MWLLVIGEVIFGSENKLVSIVISPSETNRLNEVDELDEWKFAIEEFSRDSKPLLERYHQ